ncbi:DUF2163 domain-containing protein [Henriciella litoralis]|uniref:DUF2163 domain-containing protein n=1 Tax=Henriciella litoralis TaxID=568102 RepID=UPI0009FF5026|nr:DUF2163 domain-containing protein [Henriciella litoralis]
MKLIDNAFAMRLSADVLTTCLCWRLERRDAVVIGLTDHDRTVQYDGLDYEPGASVAAGRFETAGGLRPGRASAAGALSADAISDADLAAGLWDGARVDVYRVDWEAPSLGELIWTGYFTEISQTGAGFEASLISLKADLERRLGRSYSRGCDARLGDARCGLTGVEGERCDKRFETCRDVFANAENFRGFPHMPGQDFLLAGPSGSGNDGGRR